MAARCLAARLGTEVKAFIDLGCFAVGTALNPGADNYYVVHGDFHDLQYAEESVDVVFTNSLDHVHQIDKVADQIGRVLKPGGQLVIDLVAASDRGKDPGFWASCWWEKSEDIISVFEDRGLTLTHRAQIDKPWIGEHIWMQKGASA